MANLMIYGAIIFLVIVAAIFSFSEFLDHFFCPKCESENIEDLEYGYYGFIKHHCLDCGHEWK